MSSYFDNFPKIKYPYYGKIIPATYNTTVEVVDMSIRFKLVEIITRTPSSYYNFYWKDGMRLDTIAFDYYGDENMSWLVMMSADIFDWTYDLPMNSDVFDKYLLDKYQVTSISPLESAIHHYEDSKGYILDEASFAFSTDPKKRIVYVYDYENEQNEERRYVKLVSKNLMPAIQQELHDKLLDIKNKRAALGIE